jgi:hypothetical protein
VASISPHPVPVFPLPGIVLFPGTTLPLHVFELRYRTMVRDALSGGRQLAMAVLKPGWELDYYGSPEFHDLGCLVRFDEVEWLPNDCYDLRVTGGCDSSGSSRNSLTGPRASTRCPSILIRRTTRWSNSIAGRWPRASSDTG